YTAGVKLWWRHEKAASFLWPARGAGASVRPVEVKGWVARARTGGPSPAITHAKDFGVRFWAWWVSINPEWGRRLAQKGDGDWTGLASQTGPNGLLNVIMCLRWWRDELREESSDWKEAVADVHWAL
ncbi:hypothetical protein B0H12DRAFT_993558, partial [Mycena haematopus]